MDYSLVPIHKHPEYIQECCHMINSEWKRSDTARLRSLESSCDSLPVSLILLKNEKLLGHLKVSPIPKYKNAGYLETVVIDKKQRGQGYGTVLMKLSEEYCRNFLKLKTLFLSTLGQEVFYEKLGYAECKPISIYGSYNDCEFEMKNQSKVNVVLSMGAPAAPPMPLATTFVTGKIKIHMKKEL